MESRTGRIEVICGSMFCGKTEEILKRARWAVKARQVVQAFKPNMDDRYGIGYITSHTNQKMEALALGYPSQILDKLHKATTVVVVDEVQFWDNRFVSIAEELVEGGIRIITAGLDTDFRGEAFGCMPKLMTVAEEVLKLHAVCEICQGEACRTQRLVNGLPAYQDDPLILIGAHESYEARCRTHHEVPVRELVVEVKV